MEQATIHVPVKVFEFLKSREQPADRTDVAKALGIPEEKARKALSRMLAAGTIIAHEKKSHKAIGTFSANPEAYITKVHNGTITVMTDGKKPPRPPKPEVSLKTKRRAAKIAAKAKVEEVKVEDVKVEAEAKEEPKEVSDREGRSGTRGKGTGQFNDEGTGEIDFEYQRGYSNGYNDAMFHTQRDAYQAGKRVVIEGLLKILKVDAKVLMS